MKHPHCSALPTAPAGTEALMIGKRSVMASWLVTLCLALPGAAVAAEPEPEGDYARFAGAEAGERRMIEVAPGVAVPFRWCPPGEFVMGSSEREKELLREFGMNDRFFDSEVERRVILTRGFWLAETPVTQGQWQAVVGASILDMMSQEISKYYVESENTAMTYVNHREAEIWCSRAGRHAGIQGWSMVLPTEAQWEYACRAGTRGMTYAGDIEFLSGYNAPGLDAIAWYGGNSSVGFSATTGRNVSRRQGLQFPGEWAGPRRVGQKRANPWGLHDMLGNVWEWCSDWYGAYAAEVVRNPEGPAEGAQRVKRGGSWNVFGVSCRAAYRHRAGPGFRDADIGFRPALIYSE